MLLQNYISCTITTNKNKKNIATFKGIVEIHTLLHLDIQHLQAPSRWSVGSTPLSSPSKKSLDSAEHGQMRGS